MASKQTLPRIRVAWLNGSRAQRILWLLEELQLPYEINMFYRDRLTMFAPESLTKIHPLGKSPVVTILPSEMADSSVAEPMVLAESGFITQFLCDHFAPQRNPSLVPPRWKDGMEGDVFGETEAWKRYQYLLHYSEGSLMPTLTLSLIFSKMVSNAPLLIRPIASVIASKLNALLVFPNAKRHLALLEEFLTTAPDVVNPGQPAFLCGDRLTAADILMSFPLIAAKDRFQDMGRWDGGSPRVAFPRVFAYIDRLEQQEGYRKSVDRVKQLDGGQFEATAG